jgi:hypothetical protein
MNTLRRLYRGLEAVNGADSGVDPVDYLVAVDRGPGATRQELVLVREADDGAVEIALALEHSALDRLETSAGALDDTALADTLPIVEGLSHLLYLVEAVRRERPVSGLELETQAEVDKLALCLLHRWPTAAADYPALVDRLFCQWSLVPGLGGLRERYTLANRFALMFARMLAPLVRDARLGRLRGALRQFWAADMAEKLRLAGA